MKQILLTRVLLSFMAVAALSQEPDVAVPNEAAFPRGRNLAGLPKPMVHDISAGILGGKFAKYQNILVSICFVCFEKQDRGLSTNLNRGNVSDRGQ